MPSARRATPTWRNEPRGDDISNSPCDRRLEAGDEAHDEVDELDADERGDDAAESVDEEVATEDAAGADRAILHSAERQRDQEHDDERVEDDR